MTGTHVGGPLDGQPAKPFRGRWSTWQDENGKHVPTPEGDKRYLGHWHLTGPAFYVHDDDVPGTYVHSTAWRAWRRRPLAASAT